MSFVHHESILKAFYKWGLNSIFLSTISESGMLSKRLADMLKGGTTVNDDIETIKTLARMELLLSQIVYAMNLKTDVDKQIVIELENLTDRVLTPEPRRKG